MSALLVDIGNTQIKWARLTGDRLGRQRAAVHKGWRVADFAAKVIGDGRNVRRIIAVSVAGEKVDRMFVSAARRTCRVLPEFVASRRTLDGVTTMYAEPWRLGADRFVAVIGAYHMTRGRPVCVIDVGTTITVDIVDARGRHRGGAIVPAPGLMIDSLLRNTNGIGLRAQGASIGRKFFARTTRDAIEQGTRYAAAAIIDRAVEEARRELKVRPVVVVTGGGAGAVTPLLRSRYVLVPDLVLRGLAVLARKKSVATASRHS